MKNILVPTDFSVYARKAALYASEIASNNGSKIYLLHVIEPVTDSIRQPYPLHQKLHDEIAFNRQKELNAVMESISCQYPEIKIETALIEGSIIASVADFADNNQADLIVMGTKGATGLKEIFLGSIAAGTIGKTKVPVLAVPGEYEMEKPDRILFATNHFEQSKELVNTIVDIATLFSASIHVAVFIDTDTASAAEYLFNTRQLNYYINFLKKAYPDVNFKGELLEGSKFEGTIEQYYKINEVDIIAMITYPKSMWDRFMKKSMTKKMAFHSTIPVLAIPAKIHIPA